MARISQGEKSRKTRRVRRVLIQHPYGLRESELTRVLGWDRRTVNNYLRALQRKGLIYKEGWDWFAD
jgi:DNA-binding IclR family transcriptional regulator